MFPRPKIKRRKKEIEYENSSTWDYRHTLLKTAKTLTEMGGLEDMLLTTKIPAAGFLRVEDLRAELEEVRMALQPQEAEDYIAVQPAPE